VTLVQLVGGYEMIETPERYLEPKHALLADRPAAAQLEPASEGDLPPWKAIAGLVTTLAILIGR